jgi:hypothetical protein
MNARITVGAKVRDFRDVESVYVYAPQFGKGRNVKVYFTLAGESTSLEFNNTEEDMTIEALGEDAEPADDPRRI